VSGVLSSNFWLWMMAGLFIRLANCVGIFVPSGIVPIPLPM